MSKSEADMTAEEYLKERLKHVGLSDAEIESLVQKILVNASGEE